MDQRGVAESAQAQEPAPPQAPAPMLSLGVLNKTLATGSPSADPGPKVAREEHRLREPTAMGQFAAFALRPPGLCTRCPVPSSWATSSLLQQPEEWKLRHRHRDTP